MIPLTITKATNNNNAPHNFRHKSWKGWIMEVLEVDVLEDDAIFDSAGA